MARSHGSWRLWSQTSSVAIFFLSSLVIFCQVLCTWSCFISMALRVSCSLMGSLMHHYFNIAQCDKAVGFSSKEIISSVLNRLVLTIFSPTLTRPLYLKSYLEEIFYWVQLISIKQRVISNTAYLHIQKKPLETGWSYEFASKKPTEHYIFINVKNRFGFF